MSKLGGLKRWHAEKWTNQQDGGTRPCGDYNGKGYPKCRPSKRVNEDSPKTWSELSPEQKEKAIADKKKTKTRTSSVRFSKTKALLK